MVTYLSYTLKFHFNAFLKLNLLVRITAGSFESTGLILFFTMRNAQNRQDLKCRPFLNL
jgi:hypothetical protein